ncbi:uncharacterized protein [Montipora foliosa]|uniref:uncharacterized protein n=1 Tax=Montipora foliosa TaxID=591990 RepID=UPI0035F21740
MPTSVNSEQSTVRNVRQFQEGQPRQDQRGVPRLLIRHSFSHGASTRRKRIFCLCILCWIMVLCLTGIIIIAVVHFQSSDSKIDQITAAALIGFGVLLIVVLGWSAILYTKFQKSSSPRRDSLRPPAPREDVLAFASSEILARGASTISTNNSMSHSDSSTEGNPPRRPVFIIREPPRDDQRRFIDPSHTRFVAYHPAPAIHRSTRVLREYHERAPGVARPQVSRFPEPSRGYTEPPRLVADTDRVIRHVRAHSNPLPPPYQPALPLARPLSESLPMGFPPPAYDRVFGRRRGRCGSTASVESTLYPPDYQSAPPSPSHLPPVVAPERRASLSVSPDQARIDLGIQISSSLPPLGRATRLLDPSPQPTAQRPSHTSEMANGENVIYQSPPPRSTPVAIVSETRQLSPNHNRSAATPFRSSPNSSSQVRSPVTLVSCVSERATRQSNTSPVFLTNNRSPFSRPILSLTAPENIIQESVDHEEIEEINDGIAENETLRTTNQVDQERPNVVLVYLSQSREEEIIV